MQILQKKCRLGADLLFWLQINYHGCSVDAGGEWGGGYDLPPNIFAILLVLEWVWSVADSVYV